MYIINNTEILLHLIWFLIILLYKNGPFFKILFNLSPYLLKVVLNSYNISLDLFKLALIKSLLIFVFSIDFLSKIILKLDFIANNKNVFLFNIKITIKIKLQFFLGGKNSTQHT